MNIRQKTAKVIKKLTTALQMTSETFTVALTDLFNEAKWPVKQPFLSRTSISFQAIQIIYFNLKDKLQHI